MNEEVLPTDVNLQEYLTIINNSIKTFRSLITDIGTIAEVEGDMIVVEPVNLHETLDNIEWSLTDKIKASGARIIRNFDVHDIQFSKKNLRSILYNMICNAIKFRNSEPPLVSITTYSKGETCLLIIEDNGKGIPAKGIDKIFDMYGRLNQDIEGTGIGLYLAKKIINAAGGSIRVESEPNKGTKFTIDLGSKCMDK